MLDKPSVKAIVTNSHDITERKRAEKALQQAEISARSTLDSLFAHIAILDHTGTIVDTNRAWREFPASNEADPASVAEGINHLEVCDRVSGDSSEEAAPFAEGIRDIIAGRQETFELEYPCHSPTQKRWFVGRVTRFPETYPPRIVVAHINITYYKQVEEELQEANRRLSELVVLKADFTAMATHELDIAVIYGYAEMLAAGELEPALSRLSFWPRSRKKPTCCISL